jgi:serine/threonine-protein kinase 24/25/MST4
VGIWKVAPRKRQVLCRVIVGAPFPTVGLDVDSFRNTLSAKEDDDEWVFDTVKASTLVISDDPEANKRVAPQVLDSGDELAQMMDDLHVPATPSQPKHPANSTVRRTPASDPSPSIKRANTKRRSSGVKQPLGLDLSFGNSPSTVRQFRRVSDKLPGDSGLKLPPGMDENIGPRTLFTETISKEAQLGRKAYSKAIGLACQEILANTADREKREAISRLAEAWSDLEMIDPEGVYHIVKLSNDKLKESVYSPETFIRIY